jgi:hypothetical protein
MIDLLCRYYSDLNHVIYHAIIILGITIGLFKFKNLCSSSRLFLLLLFITLLTELTAYYCAVKYHDNRFIYNPFNLVQFTIISAAFYLETHRRQVLLVFILFIGFVCFNSIFYQSFLKSSNSNTFLVEQLLIIILYFMFLVTYFKNAGEGTLKSYPLFWIGLGWLVFSVTSIVAFGFDYITAEGSYWDKISVWVKRISNYLLYLSFIVAFLSPQKSLNDITAGK